MRNMSILSLVIAVFAIVGGFALGAIRKKGLVAFAVTLSVYSLVLLELASLLILRVETGRWVFEYNENPNPKLFSPHPYLTAIPKPDSHETYLGKRISHNSDGFRGPPIADKSKRIRIAAVGGSTTYGVAVSDEETWPAKLQEILGSEFEVINFGVPGYDSVENLHFAAYQLPKYAPDIVLLHVGLNDLHVEHAPNLAVDYANLHPELFSRGMGFCYIDQLPHFASVLMLNAGLRRIGLAPNCGELPAGPKHRELDPAALAFYENSVRALLSVLQSYTERQIFVPQIVVSGAKGGEDMSWWFPFLDEKVIPEHMKAYNAVTKKIALEKNAAYLLDVERSEWTTSDFADSLHLNGNGNKKLALLIANFLRAD